MKDFRLLDLFCGAGGAGMGYYKAGFHVVGVDIRPQPNYPFEFIRADAVDFLKNYGGDGWDAIHASPPCQRYSAMQHIKKNKHKYPDLVGPIRDLLNFWGIPYVIENVEGAPLRVDLMLCGSQFGLGMIRHRIFESNIQLPFLVPPCHHDNMYDPWHWGNNQQVEMSKGMGIDWFMKREEVREAIPPAYTEFIGKCLIQHIEGKTNKEQPNV